MNPMYVKFATSLVRQLLKASGIFGLTSDDELTQVVSALATVIGFGWGFWKDYKEQQKLVTAMASGSRVTERQVERMIATGEAASVTTPKNEVPY